MTVGREDGTDDSELVTRARSGDLDAYTVLVDRYTPVAHRTAVLLGAGSDAEDVVQEAFVKAFRHLGQFRADRPHADKPRADRFRAGSAFRPWLLRIVVNETRNVQRSLRRRWSLALRAGPPDGQIVDPEHDVEVAERREELLRHLRELPEKDRLVLSCRYLLELSEAETVEVLGWPAGSVKSRTARALRRLRERMEVSHG